MRIDKAKPLPFTKVEADHVLKTLKEAEEGPEGDGWFYKAEPTGNGMFLIHGFDVNGHSVGYF